MQRTGVKIKSIKHIGKQNVYNMEVANFHNFSVNGGLIVHNCGYGLMSYHSKRSELTERVDLKGLPQDCLDDYYKANKTDKQRLLKKWGVVK